MAGERNLPGLGLKAYWTLGSNGYKPDIDANMLLLSALVQPTVLSALAAAPGAPTDGDAYLASAVWSGIAAAQSIVIRDNAAWVEIVPGEGWTVYNKATNEPLRFDGAAWVADSVTVPETGITVVTKTAAYSLVDADLDGRKFMVMNLGAAHNLTVPPGLVGTEPLTVAQKGAGQTTFVPGAGVTIRSSDGNLKLRVAGSSASLVRIASDEYFLLGDLAT